MAGTKWDEWTIVKWREQVLQFTDAVTGRADLAIGIAVIDPSSPSGRFAWHRRGRSRSRQPRRKGWATPTIGIAFEWRAASAVLTRDHSR